MSIIKICFFIVLFSSLIYAQETIKFVLSNSIIESVSYTVSPDTTYSICIKLNNDGTKDFEEITKSNIGKFLRILKDDYLIQEAIIKGRITSGRILMNNLKDANEVINYIKILIK